MPRGGYDCTGAAPGSFASRQGRQMYPCGGGTTPRASQPATFPAMQHQQQPGAAGPQATMHYGYPGAAAHASYMNQQPHQQQAGGYMAGGPGAGFGLAQQPPQMQQTYTQHGYANTATMQMPGGANHGMMYAGGGYPQQPPPPQQQHASVYGAGFAPVGQAPYYRHP